MTSIKICWCTWFKLFYWLKKYLHRKIELWFNYVFIYELVVSVHLKQI